MTKEELKILTLEEFKQTLPIEFRNAINYNNSPDDYMFIVYREYCLQTISKLYNFFFTRAMESNKPTIDAQELYEYAVALKTLLWSK